MKRIISTAVIAVLLSGCGLTVTRTAGSSGPTTTTNSATTSPETDDTTGTTTGDTTGDTTDSKADSPTTTEAVTTTVATPTTEAGPTTTKPPEVGTRENPVPIGTTADLGDGWSMTVNSVNLDAAEVIRDANKYVDPPPEGKRYVLINVTTAYNGTKESSYGIDLEVLGASTNKPVRSWDATDFLTPPDPRYDGGELFQGGTVTGNEAFEIANADADTLVIIGNLPLGGQKRTFFATK